MIGLPWLIVIALVGVIVSAGSGYWKGHSDGVDSERNEWIELENELNEKINAANESANEKAREYERWKAQQQPKIVYRTKKVQDALQAAPDWRDAPIPDGVRASIASAGAASDVDSGRTIGTVPGTAASSTQDERGASGGVSARKGLWERMQSATSSVSGSR